MGNFFVTPVINKQHPVKHLFVYLFCGSGRTHIIKLLIVLKSRFLKGLGLGITYYYLVMQLFVMSMTISNVFNKHCDGYEDKGVHVQGKG